MTPIEEQLDEQLVAVAPQVALTADVVRGRMRARLFGSTLEEPRSERYAILSRHGDGGMGSVWAAWDRKLDRKVALKLLRPELIDDPAAAHRRILREAQALARVSDPHVVAVFDVTSWAPPEAPDREHVLLAMEFIAGETLAVWLKRSRPLRTVIERFVDAARGLMAAHGAGVIHGDFKPANVIVGGDGRARVVDFGLARVANDPTRALDGPLPANDDARSDEPALDADTRGALRHAGTPLYMAPEQHDAQTIDARADQYALCVSLWEAVMGRPPFRGNTLAALREAKLAFAPRGAEAPMPRWLHRVLARGLAPAAADRHPSVAALVSALQRGLAPRWRAPAVSAVLVGGLATFAALRDHDPCDGGDRRIAEVWDDDRRERGAAAFAASGLEYAGVTWNTAATRIDAWGRAWAAGWRDACQSNETGSQSDELLDLRMMCLGARLDHLDAVVELFVQGEAGTVEHAVQAASRLPGIERCADTVALRRVGAWPDDPDARAELTALARVLAAGRAELDAGHYEAAAAAGASVAAAAAATEHVPLPLVAEAMALHADALGWLGQVEAARARWREAALLAERAGDDELFVRASAGLVWELANEGARLEAAQEWAAVASATLARVGDAPHAEYLLRNAVGILAMFTKDYDSSRDEFAKAVTVVERVWGNADARLLTLHTNAGNAELKAERTAASLPHFAAALDVGIRTLGLQHPRVLLCRYDLAVALVSAGRSGEAVAEFERIIAAQRAALGRDHASLGWSLASLAMAESNISRDAAAIGHADEALALLRDLETGGYGRTVARLARARASTHLGEIESARADAQQALTELRASPHTPGDESEALAILADIALARPDGRDVEPELLDALRAADASGNPASSSAALRRMAELERSRARPELAKGWITAALLMIAASGPSPRFAAAQVTAAQILLDLGRLDEAAARLANVVLPEGSPPEWTTERELVHARLEQLRGDGPRARARVLDQLERLDPASSDRAQLERWLVDADP